MRRVCPRCGSGILPGSRFCTECGAKLEDLCPKCGSPLPGGSGLCPSCGFNLNAPSAAQAPAPGQELPGSGKVSLSKRGEEPVEVPVSTPAPEPLAGKGRVSLGKSAPQPATEPQTAQSEAKNLKSRVSLGKSAPQPEAPAQPAKSAPQTWGEIPPTVPLTAVSEPSQASAPSGTRSRSPQPNIPAQPAQSAPQSWDDFPPTVPVTATPEPSPDRSAAQPDSRFSQIPPRQPGTSPSRAAQSGGPSARHPASSTGSSARRPSQRQETSRAGDATVLLNRPPVPPQQSAPRTNPPPPKKKGNSAIVIVLVVAILICAALAIFFGIQILKPSDGDGKSDVDVSASQSSASSGGGFTFGGTSGEAGSSSSAAPAPDSGDTGFVFEGGQTAGGAQGTATPTIHLEAPTEALVTPYADTVRQLQYALEYRWDRSRLIMSNMSQKFAGLSESDVGLAFVDLNQDGTREMLVGPTNSTASGIGQVYTIYTVRNSAVTLFAMDNNDSTTLSLCGDGFLCEETISDTSGDRTAFLNSNSAAPYFQEAVVYSPGYDAEHPWLYTSGDKDSGPYSSVSEEQATQTLQKHSKMAISYQALSSLPAWQVLQDPVQQQPVQQPGTGGIQADASGYFMPTNTRYIAKEELYGLTKQDTSFILNEIYARHGCTFHNELYQNYFSSQSWYHPVDGLNASSFNDSVFNDFEKKNVDTIVNYQKEMGWR